MQRQIFLYEKSVLFCKKVGRDPETATYHFKTFLQVSKKRKRKVLKLKILLTFFALFFIPDVSSGSHRKYPRLKRRPKKA
jgi:hypothetical protein